MKIKTSIVSYHNTYPFLLGLEGTPIKHQLELMKVAPSLCTELFVKGTTDISLVPVGGLKYLKDYEIFTDFCIGADGPVYSVSLLSNCPMEQWTSVYLDTDSQTSVKLAKYLLEEKNIRVKYMKGLPDRAYMPKDAAVLMIGDKVFDNESAFMYKYDLAELWKEITSMPFVFAVWVKRSNVDLQFCAEFNEALKFGVANISTLKNKVLTSKLDLLSYLKNNISFEFDQAKKEAMSLFIQKTSPTSLIS